MKCSECPYFYAKNDERETCHYPWDDGYAPCEIEDIEEPEEEDYEYDEDEDEEPADIDDDCGFDPYLGCYTDDC
jgi:hypothetical protein